MRSRFLAVVLVSSTLAAGTTTPSQNTLAPLGHGRSAWPGTNGQHFFVTFPDTALDNRSTPLSPELLLHYPNDHACRQTVFAQWNGTDPLSERVNRATGCALSSMLIGYDSSSGFLCAAAAGETSLERAHAIFLMVSRGVLQASSEQESLGSFGPLVVRLDDNPDEDDMCPANLGFFVRTARPIPDGCARTMPSFEVVPNGRVLDDTEGTPDRVRRAIDRDEQTLEAYSDAARGNPDASLCGFAGSASHFRRVQMMAIMKSRPDLFDTSFVTYPPGETVEWTTPELQHKEQSARWACIVDVRGHSWTARLPKMLFSGRPILYVERRRLLTDGAAALNETEAVVTNQSFIDYFEDERNDAEPVRPWKHYVPVKEDLSDLVTMVEWTLTHRAEADAIAERALQHARRHVTLKQVARRFVAQLADAGSRGASADC